MRLKSLLAISLSLITILTMTACKQSTSPSNSQLDKKEVVTIEVKQEKGIEMSELSGTAQAVEETTSSFESPGRIKNINVGEGSKVKAGDVLAQLDEDSYQLQVDAAEFNLRNASAALNQISNGARAQEITIAKSKLDQASATYQKAFDDLKRYEELFKAGVISLIQYEAYKTQLTIAEKDMAVAQAAYSLTTEGASKEDRDKAAATYGSVATVKDQAVLALSKTQLKSPISGTILLKYVTTSQMVAAGTPVFKIANIDSLKVVLSVPDYEISKWKVGEKVTAKLYETSKDGTVTKILPSISQETGTVGVEVIIDNKLNDWLPGQVITCVHKIEGKDAIFVPIAAVISDGTTQSYLFVVDGEKVVKTSINPGKIQADKLEIISGLKPGDKVVTEGANRLFDQDTIKIVRG